MRDLQGRTHWNSFEGKVESDIVPIGLPGILDDNCEHVGTIWKKPPCKRGEVEIFYFVSLAGHGFDWPRNFSAVYEEAHRINSPAKIIGAGGREQERGKV